MRACRLTRTRPADGDTEGLTEWVQSEMAKRRLIFQLAELRLPVEPRREAAKTGLAFDLLSSSETKVVTGHDDGIITLDLAEADDEHRERLRLQLSEPDRTVLGHFLHEIGHYYWPILVEPAGRWASAGRCSATIGPLRGGGEAPLRAPAGDRPGRQLHQPLRHHAPLRGLGGDLRPLPPHPRHPADGRNLPLGATDTVGAGASARRTGVHPTRPVGSTTFGDVVEPGWSSPTLSTRSTVRSVIRTCTRSSWPPTSSGSWPPSTISCTRGSHVGKPMSEEPHPSTARSGGPWGPATGRWHRGSRGRARAYRSDVSVFARPWTP